MKTIILALSLMLISNSLYARFNIDEYKKYLLSHKDMTVEQLLDEYPAGYFLKTAPTSFSGTHYADRIDMEYKLTAYEKSLISNHGFMVSERLNYYTFMQAFWDVYNKDLPVYISSDAILQALHYSFDNILIEYETSLLLKKLSSALEKMKTQLGTMSATGSPTVYKSALYDVDIYLTVTLKLLNIDSKCTFPENNDVIEEILSLIEAQNMRLYALFSSTTREIDFSQFTVRGHYTRSEELRKYFKAMIWLGRTEILFTNPANSYVQHKEEDLQRMAILSALLAETAFQSDADIDLEAIDNILEMLLGRQDNINLWEVKGTLDMLGYSAYDLTDKTKWIRFREEILKFNSANQLYNSQILFSDPFSPNKVRPPATFLLMGQRPIIDGFISANVVYDNILFKGIKVRRMVPSTLDILFSIGNDAAIQILIDELEKYPYSSNLAALRYLIESYDDDFWKSSCYTNWLNTIRSLNPPARRENLPMFMQTAAWWQKTMNTQLASWAQLRHDFLLYAKQPYTIGISCSYPYGYVEPVPDFYDRIISFFESMKLLTNSKYCDDLLYSKEYLIGFYDKWIKTCSSLKAISEKELKGIEFNDQDIHFIQSLISMGNAGCYQSPAGWYPELYYRFDEQSEYMTDMSRRGNASDDFIVADIHTIPTNESGNTVGWVLHAGTGRINMAVIAAPLPGGGNRAYIGPVSSYYEFLSNNFKRLTNEEWRKNDFQGISRPPFTNLYLANRSGESPAGNKVSLLTMLSNKEDKPKIDNNLYLKNYPNPFSRSTLISFIVPNSLAGKNAELTIVNSSGKLIKSLAKDDLPANNYTIVWDGTDNSGLAVPSGAYLYNLRIGNVIESGKMNLAR